MVRFGLLLSALLLLIGAARVLAVEYDDGTPISLNLRVSATTVGPAQLVQIRIEANDMDLEDRGRGWERINDPVTLAYQVTAGELTKRSITANPVDLTWQAPMQPGVYALYVTATDSGRYFEDYTERRVVEFTVQQAGGNVFVPTVRVGANPQTIRLDRQTSTNLTAQVFGEDKAGKEVTFFATGGALSAARATTNNAGQATVKLTVTPDDLGTITVAASFGNTTSTTTVQVVDRNPGPVHPLPPTFPPPPIGNISPGFTISVEPNVLPADGESTALVRIRLTDPRGLPIQRQNVTFRSTIGSIAPRMTITDYYGGATAQIQAPDEPGAGYIVVNAGALQNYATIVFEPIEDDGPVGQPRIFLTIDPTEQMADGAAKVRVEALVLDGNNRAIVDEEINFSTTLGRIGQGTVVTDEEGRASTTLTAPDRPGLAVVTAAMGRLTAASQVQFQGGTAGGAQLEIAQWAGQQTTFVAPKWLKRDVRMEGGGKSTTTSELQILDDTGKPAFQVALGANGVIVRDQYGLAHGYGIEQNDTATVVILQQNGRMQHTITIPLAIGSHLADVRYAEPGGQVLVSIAQPDGTRPEVHFYGPVGDEVLTLGQGLERLPVMALGGDGYLAMALPGGSVRLYNGLGQPVSEGRRTDGLEARSVQVGPGGQWVAVAAALAGQDQRPPVVSVFSSQGGMPFATYQLDAVRMAPVSATALVVATPDTTALLNLAGKNIAWKISGGFERFLAVADMGILAGHYGGEDAGATGRVTFIQLRDGRLIVTEPFDTGRIVALTPPALDGTVGVLGEFYALNLALPK
ncbi:MAG: Ig-like domain-containing protein [Armatimonadota bacterium]